MSEGLQRGKPHGLSCDHTAMRLCYTITSHTQKQLQSSQDSLGEPLLPSAFEEVASLKTALCTRQSSCLLCEHRSCLGTALWFPTPLISTLQQVPPLSRHCTTSSAACSNRAQSHQTTFTRNEGSVEGHERPTVPTVPLSQQQYSSNANSVHKHLLSEESIAK